MNIPEKYNQKFIDYAKDYGRAYSDAGRYGVMVVPAVDYDKPHWQVIGVHHLTGKENHGQHNAFCDVLDENGVRVNGTRINILTNGQPRGTMVIDKPANEPGTNTQMHWNDTLSLFIDRDGLPSEQVAGLHTRWDDEEAGTTRGHHSFYVVWQKSVGVEEPEEPDEEEPETPIPGEPLFTEAERAVLIQALQILIRKLGGLAAMRPFL